MEENAWYIALLIVSIGLTVAVGRVLVRAAGLITPNVFRDPRIVRSVTLLLSVLFHLVTLGVLAIVSVLEIGGDNAAREFVVKLGVVLIVLGVSYGTSVLALVRVRDRRRAAQTPEQVQDRPERGTSTVPSHSAPAASNDPGQQPTSERAEAPADHPAT